jgi:hypothetical protein
VEKAAKPALAEGVLNPAPSDDAMGQLNQLVLVGRGQRVLEPHGMRDRSGNARSV